MTRALLVGLISLTTAAATLGSAFADGVALVQTQTPRRGAAARVVTAYGSAAPSSLSVRNLTLAQPGQVTAVLATAGQAVRKGQVLMTFATAPTALSAYRQAQTAVTQAQAQRQHAAQLLAQQLATKDQLAAADKSLADAKTQLSALARDGAGRPTVTLTAPFDGLVATVPVAPGDRPASGATLLTLDQAAGLQVSLGLEPGWRNQIRIGQPVLLEPLGGGPSLQGRVVRIDAVLNPRSRLVDVDVSAPTGQVIAGQAFRGRISVGQLQGWLAPHGAVRVEDGKAFVFQISGGKAARVSVRVVQAGRDVDAVEGPIDASKPLVTVGAYQLDDGDAVRTR